MIDDAVGSRSLPLKIKPEREDCQHTLSGMMPAGSTSRYQYDTCKIMKREVRIVLKSKDQAAYNRMFSVILPSGPAYHPQALKIWFDRVYDWGGRL